MTPVRSEDFDPLPVDQQVRKQLDLLPVQSDDTDLLFFDTTTDERLSKLVHKLSFDLVLYEVTNTGVVTWHLVRVNEYGSDAVTPSVQHDARLGG